MHCLAIIASLLILLHSCSLRDAKSSGPHKLKPANAEQVGPSKLFSCQRYKDCQISDGKAGKSLEAAQKVWVTPFQNIKPDEITQNDLNNMLAVAEAAVNNELLFNKAINNAGGIETPLGAKLFAGKRANKIFKLLGYIQTVNIHKRVGITLHMASQLPEFTTKLNINVKADSLTPGKEMISYLSVDKNGGNKTHGQNHQNGSNNN